MRESLNAIDKYQGLYVRPTHDAEKDLIKPLLCNQFFRSPKLNILLTNYSIQRPEDRTETICEIMKHLWPKNINKKIFLNFREFENFLLAVGKRDHFLHQFLVFLLGCNIMDLLLKKFPGADDRVRIFGFSDEKFIYYTWLMAATYHDFGYPIQIAAGISKKLSNLYESFGMINLSKKYEIFDTKPDLGQEEKFDELVIKTGNANIDRHETLRFGEILIDQVTIALGLSKTQSLALLSRLSSIADHGYLSAHILGRAVLIPLIKRHQGDWAKVTNSKLYQSVLKSTAAVALHNLKLKRDRKRINKDANFYAFLLYLIDNLQDWSRFSTSGSKWPRFWLSNFRANENDYTVKIDYRLFHSCWTPKMETRIRKGLREKKDAIYSLTESPNRLGITVDIIYQNHYPRIHESISISF